MAEPGFRSLADQLRAWPAERLTRLLAGRPDLAATAPRDSAQLASRAATRHSLRSAVDQLDLLELFVLDAVVLAGPTTRERVIALVAAARADVDGAIERLLDLALVWESHSGLRTYGQITEAMSGPAAGTSGLRPFSARPAPPADLTDRIAGLSPDAATLLAHVVDRGGEAVSNGARRSVTPAEAASPAEELIARHLLVPAGAVSVIVPGEVGVALRGGRTTADPVPSLPQPETVERAQRTVDQVAAGAAFEAVRRVELLLDHWSTDPPHILRSGGLGVRDLRSTATVLQLEQPVVALLVEVANAAGLLGTSPPSLDGSQLWLPSERFDTWVGQPAAERWLALVRAWLDCWRLPALVGTRDAAGKTWNALLPELGSLTMPETRAATLAALADLPAGTALDPTDGPASLLARLEWQLPRRPRARADQVTWTLDEAAVLGVTALGALASYARRLLLEDDAGAVTDLSRLLPRPVDHVLLQADLTAVAPGPLEPRTARIMQLVADLESHGGAAVYRFSSGSVRRALDTGWTAVELHDFLATASSTPVPQPLTYLVDDTARTFGTIRLGHAEAFIRSDDESALTTLLHNRRAASLGLRRLAPTVLVSATPLDVLLPRLRELGAAPVVEAEDGTVHVAAPEVRRARTPRPYRAMGRAAPSLAAAVRAIRSGDQATAAEAMLPGLSLTPAGSLAALRSAAEGEESVLISYVDNHGTRSDRVVDPVSVDGGVLTAHDQRSGEVRTFAVHRITTVRPLG